MASGNSLCFSMITRKSNTISLFPLEFPRFLPSNEFSRNNSTSANFGALRTWRFALLHSRCNKIGDYKELRRSRCPDLEQEERRVSPAARGLLPFAASNNETAVHRRIKRLSFSLSLFLVWSPCPCPAGIFRETRPRVASFGCLSSPLHYSLSTSFRTVTEDKGILFVFYFSCTARCP